LHSLVYYELTLFVMT